MENEEKNWEIQKIDFYDVTGSVLYSFEWSSALPKWQLFCNLDNTNVQYSITFYLQGLWTSIWFHHFEAE